MKKPKPKIMMKAMRWAIVETKPAELLAVFAKGVTRADLEMGLETGYRLGRVSVEEPMPMCRQTRNRNPKGGTS
mgnify:CR=1 FL=1